MRSVNTNSDGSIAPGNDSGSFNAGGATSEANAGDEGGDYGADGSTGGIDNKTLMIGGAALAAIILLNKKK